MNPAPEAIVPGPAGPRAWSGSRVVWVTVAFTVLQTSIVLRWGKAPTFSHGPVEVAGETILPGQCALARALAGVVIPAGTLLVIARPAV